MVPSAERVAAAAEVAAIAAPALAPQLTIIELTTLLIAVVVAIAAARVAEPFLVPVVAGILLSYALRPLVTLLERGKVPRVAAAALVISVLVGLLSGIGYAIRDDVSAAVAELPGAARKLRLSINESSQPGPMTHVKEAAKELDRAAAEASGAKPAPAPPPDRVVSQVQTFVEAQYAKVMTVFVEALFALLLAFFLLASGDTFRRKVAKLAGDSLARTARHGGGAERYRRAGTALSVDAARQRTS